MPCTGGLGDAPRQLNNPHGIAIFGGDLFVCDTDNRRVQVFALKGMTLRAIWGPLRIVQANSQWHVTPVKANQARTGSREECDPQVRPAFPGGTWQPYDIVFDERGSAFISDFANGLVLRFDRQGRLESVLGPLNQPTHLAIDRHGYVYVVHENNTQLAIFGRGGNRLDEFEAEVMDRPDKVESHFNEPEFTMDRQGNLYLGDRCEPPPECPLEIAFDLHGRRLQLNLLTPAERQALQFALMRFEEEGVYLSTALDSKTYRCQWHRIVIEGDLPKGTSVRVDTLTSEVEYDTGDLQDLPETSWRTQQRVTALGEDGWDCLITSASGRFLYLRMTLRGNGTDTPRLKLVRVYFPRISLRRYLPAIFGEDPVSGDFTDRVLSVFDTIQRGVEAQVDTFARYLDPLATLPERNPRTQAEFFAWLASWMGLVLDRTWDERRRRRWLKEAHQLWRLRGTVEGLRQHLLIFLGWEPRARCGHRWGTASGGRMQRRCSLPPASGCACRWQPPALILEHFKLRRWLFVGAAQLGERAVLWGQRIVNRSQLNEGAQLDGTQLITSGDPVRDPFQLYAHRFSVFIPAACARTEAQQQAIEQIIVQNKPAHTGHQLEFVQARFRIGIQSSIGLNSVIGGYPKGFTLDGHRLGYDTLMDEPAEQQGGPTLEIASQSRIGSTTILD